MAYQNREYRLRVHLDGTSTPADGTVDFTLDSDSGTPPYIAGPELNLLKGRTESRPWQVRVRDTANALTGNFGANGRPDILMRLVELQVNEDAGGWATAAIGRAVGYNEEDGPDSMLVRVSDERMIERETEIFGADFRENAFGNRATTTIVPQGRLIPWRGYAASDAVSAVVDDLDGNYVRLRIRRRPTAAAVRFIEADVRVSAPMFVASTTSGYFRHARLHLDGSDYYIASLSSGRDELPLHDFKRAADGEIDSTYVWIYMATPPSVGTTYSPAYIYAPDADPTPELRYHFSGHPFAIVEAIYDEIGVRYDAAAMAALKADTRFGQVHFAADKLWKASAWLEQKIFLPTFCYPLPNDAGEIVLASLLMPQFSDAAFTALPELDASSVATFPSWRHNAERAITVVRATMAKYLPAGVAGVVITDPYGMFGSPAPREVMLDGLALETVPYLRRHDTIDRMGEKPVDVDFEGWISAAERATRGGGALGDIIVLPAPEDAEGRIDAFAREVFNRWGDGPIEGDFEAMESAGAITTPDYFRLNLDSYPNPGANGGAGGRGGVRVIQAVRRSFGPVGYDFEYLDTGAANQPLSVPTVTIAQNATDPKNAVDVTIAGLDAGAHCILKFGLDDPPTSWHRSEAYDPDDPAAELVDGTYTFTRFPSGRDISVKGYAAKVGRISSEFSAVDVVATEALDPPTGLAATVIGNSVQVTLTSTEDFPLQPMRAGVRYGPRLPIGSTVILFEENPAGLQAFGAKYVDAYGGESTVATVNATPAADATLDTPVEVRVRQGRDSTGVGQLPPADQTIGYGLEVAWRASNHGRAVWQLSTDSGFATIERTFEFEPGRDAAFLFSKFDNTLRHARMRFERDGFTESAWSSTISAYPTALLFIDRQRPDEFAGGWASLRIDETGRAWLDIGSDDPDAVRAYYEVSTTAIPTVTTADSASEDEDWPESIDTGIVLARGESAYATVRFWGLLTGLGTSVTHSVTAPLDLSGQPVVVTASFDSASLMLTVSCDADTRSVLVGRTDGGGVQSIEVDGSFAIIDIGALGMTTADRWVVDVIARSDPTDDVDGSTLTSTLPMELTGSAWSAGTDPQFLAGSAGVSMALPAVGDDTVTVTLDATSNSASYELLIYEQHRTDTEGWSSAVDITAATSPAATGDAPPTSPTAYAWDTGAQRVAKGTAGLVVYYQRLTVEIMETASGDVKNSRPVERSWSIIPS